MSRFIIISLVVITLAMVAANFILGFIRRIFGFAPSSQASAKKKIEDDVLYKKDDTIVLRGESEEKK